MACPRPSVQDGLSTVPTSKVTPTYVQHERRQWMKALRAPQQNTHGRAVHYGRQGNRLSKWSKALMLKLPVEDSKTSVSDTASVLQALVSFQYQNETCRLFGVLSSSPQANPNEAQASIKETGCSKCWATRRPEELETLSKLNKSCSRAVRTE